MRWFGRYDDSGEETARAYDEHLARIRRSLKDGAELLPDLDLHDGQVRSYRHGGSVFELVILAGDLQRGYEFVTLRYGEAVLLDLPRDGVRRLRLRARGTEILDTEVDVAPDGEFEHRILLWPRRELGIRFRSVDVYRSPATAAARR